MHPSLSHRFSGPACRPWPNRAVRVALVITDLALGGAERALTALATRLDPTRWLPSVICLAGRGRLAEVLDEANVACQCLGAHRRNPVQAVTRLARSLRQFRPELVQSFMFHANVASRLGSLCGGCPRVVGGLRVAEHEKRWHLVVDRLTDPLSSCSVCVSEGVLRFSRDVVGLDPTRLTVIPNGVDTAPFDAAQRMPRAQIHVPDDAHLALYLGRLDHQKGLPDLLDAAERVVVVHRNWYLALAGDGPHRAWLLEQLGQRAPLRGRVQWIGHREDVPGLLKSADVLVLPSLWEGMPNAVLEAMAARRPVIGTAVEGTEDLVVPGSTGWLVPPHDVVALSQALIEAAGSPERCRRFGDEGRRRVEHEFSLQTTVTAYERLWAGILGFQLPNAHVPPAEP